MRRWFFGFREGLGIFTRSGVAGLLTMFSFTVLAGLLSAIWAANLTLEKARLELLARFELEAYLLPGRDASAGEIAKLISERKGVIEINIISREDAARQFADRFGNELFDLLGENPLPISIKISYNPQQVTQEKLSLEVEEINALDGIDEVVYEGNLLSKLENIITNARDRLLLLVIVITLIALLLTMQAVRVASRAVQPWVRAVSLVGGTAFQIKLPFAVAGALSAAVGSVTGVTILLIIQTILARDTTIIPEPQLSVAFKIIMLIVVLGSTTAAVAAPRELVHKPIA